MFTLKRGQAGTRIIFLICGLAISSWAPMVPVVKDRLKLNDSSLGLLLLFLGAGAIITMPVTGWLIHKIGSRFVIIASALLISITFPIILSLTAWLPVAVILFLFGAGIGSIDVAMNTHGAQLQNMAGKHIMSSLHGFFSIGGLIGPIIVGVLLWLGLTPVVTALCISIGLVVITLGQLNSLMDYTTELNIANKDNSLTEAEKNISFNLFNGTLIFLGVLCFLSFLSEGAVLDWSALFLRDTKGVNGAMSGLGYASFSIAMAIMRLFGDRIVSRLNGKKVVVFGSLAAFSGFMLVVFSPIIFGTFIGFVFVGIGAANIVPILFTAAGRIKNIPGARAISVISTMGYAGQLAGPALLGYLAHYFSLSTALFITGLLILFVGIWYQIKTLRIAH